MKSVGARDNIENEVLARETNEWIAQMGQSFGVGEGAVNYICECSAPDCPNTVSLPRNAYELARSDGRHFIICSNHENPELDYVVMQDEGFAVVEVLPGRSSRIARETDPRLN